MNFGGLGLLEAEGAGGRLEQTLAPAVFQSSASRRG
jgi:hypothetical protein